MISNKQKVNIFIVLLIIVICSILITNKNKNQKENFTDISQLNYLQGLSGNVGPQGNIGNQGIEGTVGKSFEINDINLYLKNKLTLGTKELVYVTKSDTGDYSQLKLSKKIKKNGSKLKMSKNDFDDESMYIHSESKNETDFYINNKKMYMNGNIEINGDLTLQNNDLFHSLPKDIIPIGTIFPFFFENANKKDLHSGYYKLSGFANGSLFYIEKISPGLYFIAQLYTVSSLDHDFRNLYYNETDNNINANYVKEDSNKFIIKYTGTGDVYTISPFNKEKYLNSSSGVFDSSSNTKVTITPEIPYGWKICDGVSTTVNHNGNPTTINVPNLDKMVVGKDNNNSMFSYVGKTGGTTSDKHTIDCNTTSSCEMPEHNHSISSDGSHTHEFLNMTQTKSVHSHDIGVLLGNDNNFSNNLNYSFVKATDIPKTIISTENLLYIPKNVFSTSKTTISPPKTIISTEQSHNHNFNVIEAGNHNHNGNTNNDNDRLDTDVANPINIEPYYMKLVYIIKII